MAKKPIQDIKLSREQALMIVMGKDRSGDSVQLLGELLESGLVEPADETWIKHQQSIIETKLHRAKQKAQALSTNEEFVKKVKALRVEWNITPSLPEVLPGEDPEEKLSPENILQKWAFSDSNASSQKRQMLMDDLETELCKPFDLNWFHDFGIIVGAVCFGLTRENILEHWDRISFTLAKEVSPGVTIEVRTKMSGDRLMSALAVTALLHLLEEHGISRQVLPVSIQEAIKYVQDLPRQTPQLLLHIEPNTSRNDVVRTWPQVQGYQQDLWGMPKSKTREWREYERDTAIGILVNKREMSLDEAYDAWLNDNPTVKPLSISTIKRGANKAKFVWTDEENY